MGLILGSTGVKMKVEFTVLAYVIQPKLLNANNNFAPSEFALAA
tara:strand:- start:139 stop:270 length:132 start_codon:yes stop_codon:yes gene_type:complete